MSNVIYGGGGWRVETLNETVDEEIAALPSDQLARFLRIGDLIETHGLPSVGAPYVDHIEGPIWEMRLKGRDGISRALYMAIHPRRVIVLRVFVKKTQKTPRSEIKLALKRAGDIK